MPLSLPMKKQASMKVAADENLFEPIIDYLRKLGHDVLSIRDTSHSGISDDEIYTLACREKRVIMTMDKDFSRILRFPPERCGGIVVVKIYKRPVEELVIITPEGVRIRRTK